MQWEGDRVVLAKQFVHECKIAGQHRVFRLEKVAEIGMIERVQRMPARRNDCTNCRWNNRKATSSGAALSSVAAVMIDHWIPWSPDEKICRPTVSGREVTELVTISGHRKLFQ